MEEGGVAPTDIELRHVAFLSVAECEITSSEGTASGTFAVIRWKTSGGPLQDLFLEVLGSWIGTLGHSPNTSRIRTGFDRLAQVFADLERPGSGRCKCLPLRGVGQPAVLCRPLGVAECERCFRRKRMQVGSPADAQRREARQGLLEDRQGIIRPAQAAEEYGVDAQQITALAIGQRVPVEAAQRLEDETF